MPSFAKSRTFLGDAISTAASPLRNTFAEPGCSPVTPRRPVRHDDDGRDILLSVDQSRQSAYNHSPFLSTPRNITSSLKDPQTFDQYADDVSTFGSTLASPTEFMLSVPPTPNHLSKPYSEKLGTFSAINIILGKTVGVGIYSIPSSILVSVGSVGATLTLWVVGSIISFCGLAVYLDLGTGLPRSGGERIYLERIFKKPHMLATCMFMSYVVLLGFSTPNCIVLGEYALYAMEIEVNRWNVRSIAVGIITLTCIIHARYQRLGLRIINALGVGKMLILVVVIFSGFAGMMMGVGAATSPLTARRLMDNDDDFLFPAYTTSTAHRNFSNMFKGSSTQPYDYATALLKILYCFRGYNTANQILSEVRDPVPTLKRAAPIALSLVALGYILANIAYFLVVELDDFRTAGVVVAGHFFRNVFGQVVGENILPVFIIISAFGNIAATSFAQARVNQELGKDGLLPFSRFFARGSKKQSGAAQELQIPTQGLFLHWLVSVIVIVVPPPGDIYNFLVDIGGYPVSVISVGISGGLLYLQLSPQENWRSPFQARKLYTVVFLLSNCLLLVLPWCKPAPSASHRGRFPYYAYPATALSILGSGVVYWVFWSRAGLVRGALAWWNGYRIANTSGRKRGDVGAREGAAAEEIPMLRRSSCDSQSSSRGLISESESEPESNPLSQPSAVPVSSSLPRESSL